MKTEPNDPKNPIQIAKKANEHGVVIEYDNYFGLTKREYFAAMAMQGLLAKAGINGEIYTDIVTHAVLNADALINQLNQEKK